MVTISDANERYPHMKYVLQTRLAALEARLRGYIYPPLKTKPRIVTPIPKLGVWRMFGTGEMQILTEVSMADVRLDKIPVNKKRLAFCEDMLKLGFGVFPPTVITNAVGELVPVRPEKLIAQMNVLDEFKVTVWYSPSHEDEVGMPRWLLPVGGSDPEIIKLYGAKYIVEKYGDVPAMSKSSIIEECVMGEA